MTAKLIGTNYLYHNPTKSQIVRFQQIQNSLARAVVKAHKACHITPILRSVHWLKITDCIEYKLLSLTYKVITTNQPSYLHNLIFVQPARGTCFQLWSLILVHAHPPSYGSLTVPFTMPHLVSGISIRLLSDNLRPTTITLTHIIHLFLHLPPHLPVLTHPCHHPSLRRCFTPGSKPSCSTNRFHPGPPPPPSGLTPWFHDDVWPMDKLLHRCHHYQTADANRWQDVDLCQGTFVVIILTCKY